MGDRRGVWRVYERHHEKCDGTIVLGGDSERLNGQYFWVTASGGNGEEPHTMRLFDSVEYVSCALESSVKLSVEIV